MSAIYGPVQSQRLGRSLGIDPIPLKTCNWNCVYCQLGRSVPMINVRADYLPHDALMAEIAMALDALEPGSIDWITFVGSGEPTLHSALGALIRLVKQHTPLPVAVITNGSLLYRPEVRADLLAADAIMPTIAAGTNAVYHRLHRPHPACTLDRLIAGSVALRNEYDGLIWVEVMLVRGVNDMCDNLLALAERLVDVRPDAIHITIPSRAPAEPWVEPPDEATLTEAAAILSRVAPVHLPHAVVPTLTPTADLLRQVVGIIQRHPLRETQLRAMLDGVPQQEADALLAQLATGNRVRRIERLGEPFWVDETAWFPPA